MLLIFCRLTGAFWVQFRGVILPGFIAHSGVHFSARPGVAFQVLGGASAGGLRHVRRLLEPGSAGLVEPDAVVNSKLQLTL